MAHWLVITCIRAGRLNPKWAYSYSSFQWKILEAPSITSCPITLSYLYRSFFPLLTVWIRDFSPCNTSTDTGTFSNEFWDIYPHFLSGVISKSCSWLNKLMNENEQSSVRLIHIHTYLLNTKYQNVIIILIILWTTIKLEVVC